jgi:carbamate kinase
MSKHRVVLALGGNALGTNPTEQLEAVKTTARAIIDMIAQGHRVVIGHGNGPQVGVINLAFSYGNETNEQIPAMAFAECNAMSQGYIGYHLQQAIRNLIDAEGVDRSVATVVTQVEVDPDDPAFQNPTKPIGLFYTEEQAARLEAEEGYTFINDSGRGYRRVVPSPAPKHIVELDSIRCLLQNNNIVITVGGGGIPVVRDETGYRGIDAVIDKDNSSARLAGQLGADTLLVLTAVEYVAINFGTEHQENLGQISVDEARAYMAEGQFGTGSMLPKVQACLDFLEQVPDGRAIITSLENASRAISGEVGTVIRNASVPLISGGGSGAEVSW